jgi:N-hydroxyarylamine O-acetyltransferase
MYSKDQLCRVFSRIGLTFDPDAAPSAELLDAVQLAAVTHIPYENIDILRGIPLSLEPHALYDKIVVRHRGGYCFELNGFFAEVLRSLGYGVTEYMARYLRGETEIPMRRHRVIIAADCAGQKHVCDIGIGQSAFRLPLPFREGAVSEQFGETYRVTRAPFFGWVIEDLHHGAWRRFYSFTEEEQLNLDYVMPSFWCEQAPESPFRTAPILAIKTEDGRITVDGDLFRVFRGEDVEEKPIGSDAQRAAIYREYFGLDVL